MNPVKISAYSQLKDVWQNKDMKSLIVDSYIKKETSFIPYLLPAEAIKISERETIELLTKRYVK